MGEDLRSSNAGGWGGPKGPARLEVERRRADLNLRDAVKAWFRDPTTGNEDRMAAALSEVEAVAQ